MKRWTLEEINILSKTAPNWELCEQTLEGRTKKAIIKKYYELKNIKKTEVIKETPKKESFIKRLFKKLFV